MKYFIINSSSKTRNQILKEISDLALKNKIISNEQKLYKSFIEREKQVSTGFEKGIAIPHAMIDELTESSIVIVKNKNGVNWPSLDGKKTNLVISLLVKKSTSSNQEHLKILTAISSLLLIEEKVEIFRNGKITEIKKMIAHHMKKSDEENKKIKNKKYDVVAVTSCITGVAHTNMSADAILKFGQENGFTIKVERQGAQGPQTPLTRKDIKNAKYVLLAIDKPIDGMNRFNGKKVLITKTIDAIKDMSTVWKKLEKAKINESKSKDDSQVEYNNTNDKPVKLMSAIMNGLSYMIPIIIVGGLFLAFGLGIGRMALGGDVTTHPGSIWYSVFQIGVVGIQLAIVVLAGFIANALGGRMVIAPAMILAFAAQGIGMGNENWSFFNYETGTFGIKGSNLSFFGSVAAGLMMGYGGFYWNKYISPKIGKNLKTIEPIIIVPILFVFLGWILFAFILYLPLYWLSVGLDKGVSGLVDNNLLWIAGAVGGAMLCFDLGGPVNKIAFGLGVALIKTHPEVMGAIAAAGAVAPFGMAFGWLIGKKVFKIEKFKNDKLARESFVPAIFMGTLGISEGAIPYAIKYPKSAIISNIIGGAVAGAISGLFLITDSAAHTGPIVYILGAIGKNGETNYLYGLLYLLAWATGSITTSLIFPTLEWIFDKSKLKHTKKINKIKNK